MNMLGTYSLGNFAERGVCMEGARWSNLYFLLPNSKTLHQEDPEPRFAKAEVAFQGGATSC